MVARSLKIMAVLATSLAGSGCMTGVPMNANGERPTGGERPPGGERPTIVIAHRGASGYRPEHTLAAYRLAVAQGADFIEPDLVVTADRVLVARHDNLLAAVALDDQGRIVHEADGPRLLWATTDVAERPRFAGRLTVKNVDGKKLAGWFVEDFTLAEIKQLRARERMPDIRPKNTRYDDRYTIPTFAEVLALVRELEHAGTVVGVYPETKHPDYFIRTGRKLDGTAIAVDSSALLVEALVDSDFTDPDRVFIQSFESANLVDLAHRLLPAAGIELPLVQLLGVDAPIDLKRIASYASGVGVHKRVVLELAPDLVARAGRLGLFTHVYTLRIESVFVHPRFAQLGAAGAEAELAALLAMDIAGVFTDHPDITRRVVDGRQLN